MELPDPVGSGERAVHDAPIEFGAEDGREIRGREPVVLLCGVDYFDILLRVQHLRNDGRVLPADIAVVADLDIAFLALLGGHQDDAVRGSGAIDSRRCRILQDVDALDVGRVERADVAAGHTVNDIERLVRADGTHASDVHIESVTGLTGVGDDAHTGRRRLQGSKRTGAVELHDVITLDLDGRTGNQLFLLDAVTDDNDIFEEFRAAVEHDVDDTVPVHGDFL